MEDTCIICGGYVPEGAMVCPQCRIKIFAQPLPPAATLPHSTPVPMPACVYYPISGTSK